MSGITPEQKENRAGLRPSYGLNFWVHCNTADTILLEYAKI